MVEARGESLPKPSRDVLYERFLTLAGDWPPHDATECFPSGAAIKNLLAMQEMWVQFLGQEDHLEREMETHFFLCIMLGIISWE